MTINFYAIYKYFHSCSNDWHFNNLMHHSQLIFLGRHHFILILYYEEKSFSIFVFKLPRMKRKLMYAAGFVFIALSFSSCQKTCKVCQQNTYINNTLDHSSSPTEYCGTDLIKIEATPDFVLGTSTTKWECN
jgi:hypothetical protein